MDIYLTVLIGLIGICIGAFIGLGISFKINHDYILGMNDTSEKFTKNLLDIMENYFNNMIKHEENYFANTMTGLAKAVDDIIKYMRNQFGEKQKKNYHHVQDYIMAKLKVIHMEKMLCGK